MKWNRKLILNPSTTLQSLRFTFSVYSAYVGEVDEELMGLSAGADITAD